MKEKKSQRKKRKLLADSVIGLVGVLIPIIGFVFFNIFPIAVSFGAMFCDME